MTSIKQKNKLTRFQEVHWSSKTYKWNTPEEFFNGLDEEFHFDFDPAIPPRVGSFSGNGLKEHWGTKEKPSRVFVNPPYKRGLIKRWILKACKEFYLGNAAIVVLLLPMRGSEWFRILARKGAEMRLCEKRIKFESGEGNDDPAPFDSIVCILGH